MDATVDKTGLKFYSVDEAPFQIYGVKREGDRYARLPQAVADTASNTAVDIYDGKRLRTYIA